MSERTALRWRQAFFGGILGIFFACLGWFLWRASRQEVGHLIWGGVGGGILGFIIEAGSHYVHTVKDEIDQTPGTPVRAEKEHGSTRMGTSFPTYKGILTVVGALFGAAGIEVMIEFLKLMYVPLLISVLTLAPVGLVFTWAFGEVEHLTPRRGLAWGAVVGALTASMMGGIYLLLGVGFSFAGLLGWWILVGIGYGIASGDRMWANPLAPLGGMLLALSVVFTLSIPRVATVLEAVPFTTEVGHMVDRMLASPDLPLVVWSKAEKQVYEHTSAEYASASPSIHKVANYLEQPASSWTFSVLGSWIGCKTPEPSLFSQPSQSHSLITQDEMSSEERQLALAALTKPYNELTETEKHAMVRYGQQLQRVLGERRSEHHSSESEDVIVSKGENVLDRTLRQISERSRLRRQETLCEELRRGAASGLLRSWLVLSLFSFGLGVATIVEIALRPKNYLESRVYKFERRIMIGLIVAWGIGLVLFRFELLTYLQL